VREVILDGKQILSMQDVHHIVKQTLDLHHYGENLDALFDVLSTTKNVRIIIKHEALLQFHLGHDYASLMRLFEDVMTQTSLGFSIDIIN
jgi:RNAse (barnase) inhibitor barstar